MTTLRGHIQDLLAEFSQKLVLVLSSGFHEFAATGIGRQGVQAPQPGGSAPAAAAQASAPARRNPSRGGAKAPAAARRGASKKAVSPRGKLPKQGAAADGRRLPRETDALAQAFAEHVKAHPGQRIREIGAAMGQTTAVLALPVQKALRLGLVTRSGERSATAYFPATTGKR